MLCVKNCCRSAIVKEKFQEGRKRERTWLLKAISVVKARTSSGKARKRWIKSSRK
jgi:hypothetical protein